MASENLDVGTVANDGTGDDLRDAFIKVRKMFAEVYGQTYSSDTQDLSGTALEIDHGQLANRYTESSAITSATAITLDTATADVFTWTAGHSTTVAFTNVKIGATSAVIITGGGSSYTLALGNINGSAGTFNRLGGTYDDTSGTKNLIEFKFISTSEAWYQISQIAS